MNNKPVDDEAAKLADLIDRLMDGGSGRINIQSNDENGGISVITMNSTDFSCAKGACCQPTEDVGDDE